MRRTENDKRQRRSRDDDFLAGGGEMGALMRTMDWSLTGLGPVAGWPQSLRTSVSTCLNSRFPILVWWGPDFIKLYNDAYRPMLGSKHPRAMGQRGQDCWPEIWHIIGPMLEGVLGRGDATWSENQLLLLRRHGFAEECYFTFSYSPIRDESGGVGGVFSAVTETTGQVLGERRLRLLRDLAAQPAQARSVEEACALSAAVLAGGAGDIPFARIDLDDRHGWPVGVHDVAELAIDIGDGPWTERPRSAMVLALPARSGENGAGKIALGVSPRLALENEYRDFFGLVARHVAASVDNARAVEAERRRAEALAEIDRAKTAFFSSVSHEFRTPLTLMLGPLEELLDDASGAAREDLAMIHRNGQRLLRLVNALLDFARIEAGRAQASYEATDLASLTADLASNFRAACEKAGLRLEVDCAAPGAEAWVDRDMWEKIVLNLLSNAFKFTLEGGIAVRLQDAGERLRLTVSDTGIGIPRESLPRVFERFHRVENARGRSHEGSGIGLALVQELVKLHGGTVAVESEPGRGTQFVVEIPKGSAHLPRDRLGAERQGARTATRAEAFVAEAMGWLPDAGAAAPAPQRGDVPRVLVADDNADLREYAHRLLSPHYEVEVARDGAEALAAARGRRPDLIVTDVMMPNLDGFGLIRELRADGGLRDIPVIVLSARAGEEARLEGVGKGADDYLVKPFSARELLVRVGALLRSAQARRASEEALREEARLLETLNNVGRTLGAELDLERTVQAVTDAATELSGAQFGAFFYSARNTDGEPYSLHALSGARREDFEQFAAPRDTAVLAPTFGGAAVRLDDVTRDPRYRRNLPHFGLPKAHLPVRSYLAVPVISRSGEVIGGLVFGHPRPGVFTDRAERLVTGIAAQAAVAIDNARLYAESRRLVSELRESDRRKDEFLATLSHELRNPLAPLKTALQVMRLQGAAGVDAVRAIMERQVNHLVRLVDDLLEMSRITTGALQLRREPVELQAVMRNAVETSDPLIKAAHHRLDVSLPGEALCVEGDPVRLAQVLSNLLNNAARYTPPGGAIALSARREARSAVISVRDNGTGIAPECLPRIFEMFSRGEQSDAPGGAGLGIGLTLAQRLAEMHGGSIEARSEGRGRGSEFIVRLPLGATPPAPVAEPATPIRLRSSLRVLVVDDNRDAATTLGMVLKTLGAEVHIVYDGAAALEAFGAGDFAVVLLDLGMPGMDGYEVARRLRARYPERPAALVALTGWGQEDDRRRAREAGFAHHLVKPAEIDALQKLLLELDRSGDHAAPRRTA